MGRGTLPLDANATEEDAPPTDAVLPRTILRFRIDGPLGAGGMADVFRAYDPILERPVALKVLRTKQADDRRRRTLREARAAAALAHPNIITIYEVEEAEGVVVIAMELLEGRVLRQAMAEPVPLTTKLRWLLEMANALSAAHARGLVHRDVKPDNVFVCTGGPLKLLDFGIAKRSEAGEAGEGDGGAPEDDAPSSMATTEGRRIGTPRYMAPEQHLGASTDARTDQHAWGLVAFELLTGLHGAAEIATVADGLARPASESHGEGQGERGRLLGRVEGLPAPVAAAVLRALAPAKEARFPSMAPIVAAVDAALRGAVPGEMTTGASAVPQSPVVRPRIRWPWLVAGALVAAGATAYAVRSRPAPLVPAAAPVIARCRATNARTYARVDGEGSSDAVAVLPPDGELVSLRPAKEPRKASFREHGGKADPFAMLPAIDLMKVDLHGGTIHGAPALLTVLRGSRTALSFWSEDMAARFPIGIVSTRSFEEHLETVTTAQAFGDMFAVATGLQPFVSSGSPPGVIVATPAADPGARSTVTLRPGEDVAFPSAAGLPDRLAATFSTSTAIALMYFDRIGNPSGPPITVTEVPRTANGALRIPLMSALRMQPQAMSVYWLDRQSLGQMWVSTANAAGDAFGPKRVVLKESFSAEPPRVAALPDGRAALFWIATRRGAQVLRAAPILDDGSLAVPSEITSGTFRDLHVLPISTGVAVSWIDDAGELIHGLTAHCD